MQTFCRVQDLSDTALGKWLESQHNVVMQLCDGKGEGIGFMVQEYSKLTAFVFSLSACMYSMPSFLLIDSCLRR
jgi:hypothetical protein